MSETSLSVSQVNTYIKSLFDSDMRLCSITVDGEISNLKDHYASGHLYFTLKDDASCLGAVMFRTDAASLRFRPENGMKVSARGRISVWPADGRYQLYVSRMEPQGEGALAEAFVRLKNKLAAEGLFDPAHKKAIPGFPQRIGVITSGSGAAVRDIINVLGRRWPLAEILLLPVNVQGVYAAPELTAAVRRFDREKSADVLIVGRGGGSAEDLWAFNDEALARAVYACSVPVISAVGHETDFTIIDFVADLRAPTPSAAAELAVPDRLEMRSRLLELSMKLDRLMSTKLEIGRSRLTAAVSRGRLMSPGGLFDNDRLMVDSCSMRMRAGIRERISFARQKVGSLSSTVAALSPYKVLSRGYSIVSRGGEIIMKSAGVAPGDEVDITMCDGGFTAGVISLIKNDDGGQNGGEADI